MYRLIDRDPIIGERQFEIHDCQACDGSGREPWHPGCGDMSPGHCRDCDGVGQYTKRWRFISKLGAKTEYSAWQRCDPEDWHTANPEPWTTQP